MCHVAAFLHLLFYFVSCELHTVDFLVKTTFQGCYGFHDLFICFLASCFTIFFLNVLLHKQRGVTHFLWLIAILRSLSFLLLFGGILYPNTHICNFLDYTQFWLVLLHLLEATSIAQKVASTENLANCKPGLCHFNWLH